MAQKSEFGSKIYCDLHDLSNNLNMFLSFARVWFFFCQIFLNLTNHREKLKTEN